MDPRTILTRGVTTGLRLGRGTADRVVRVAAPTLGRVTDAVIVRVRRPAQRSAQRRMTTTFTPSRKAAPDVPATVPETAPGAPPAHNGTPSPATVARNIGPQRPAATPPRRAAKPKSVPGAKLPPPRPRTS